MSYCFAKSLLIACEEPVFHAVDALKGQAFTIITGIGVLRTLRMNMDAAFPNYRVLGACNPTAAFEAPTIEVEVGTMQPCNVIVQQLPAGKFEFPAIDPVAPQAIQAKLQPVQKPQ